MPAKSSRRRRWKRIALACLLAGALGVGALFVLPLPVGWAINLAARRALPPELSLTARVESATFRWRLGSDTARLDIERLTSAVEQRPLGTVAHIAIEIDKGAAWKGYYAPSLVTITEPALTVDTTDKGAFAALMAPPPAGTLPPKPSKPVVASTPATLADALPILPAPGAKSRITIERAKVSYILPQLKWTLESRFDATLTRANAAEATIEATSALGVEGKPALLSTASARLGLSTNRIEGELTIPEFELNQLPQFPGEGLPLTGTMSFSGRGDFDYSTRQLVGGSGAFLFRDGRLKLSTMEGAPIALERIALRGEVIRRDNELFARLTEGVIAIEGVALNLRQFEAGLTARSRVEWDAELSGASGRRQLPRVPASLLAGLPWLRGFLEQAALTQLASKGTALVARDADDSLKIHEVTAHQRLDIAIAGETVSADFTTRQPAPGEALATEVSVAAFEPRKLARAFPAEWHLAAAGFPVQLKAKARLTSQGEPLEAETTVTIGAGELGALPPLNRAVRLDGMFLEARMTERGTVIDIPRFAVESGIGTIRGQEIAIRRESPGAPGESARATGKIEISGIKLVDFTAFLPQATLAQLRDNGLTPADFALTHAVTTFSIEARNDATWSPQQADLAADLELVALGQPLVPRATVTLKLGERDAVATLTLKEFSPAQFGARQIAGMNLSDFAFPVQLEAEALVAADSGEVRSAKAKVTAGAGGARLAALDATVPFRSANVSAEYDPAKNLVRVSSATLELASGISASVEGVTARLSPLTLQGKALLAPLDFAAVLAWWPENLLPAVRREIAALAPSGRLQTKGIDFAVDLSDPKGAVKITRGQGELAISQAGARHTAVPGAVAVAETLVTLDFPRAIVRVKDVQVPGATVSLAHIEVTDVLAQSRDIAVRAAFAGDLSRAAEWLKGVALPPDLAPVLRSTGKLQGELTARLALKADVLTRADATLALQSDQLEVPGWFDGPLQARFDLALPSPTVATLAGTLTLNNARWLGLKERARIEPLSLRVEARDWQSTEKTTMEVALSSAHVLSAPLQLKASAELRGAEKNPARAELRELRFGRTDLRGEWQSDAQHDALTISARQIDLNELAATALPWLRLLNPALVTPPPAPTVVVAKGPAPLSPLQASSPVTVTSPSKMTAATPASKSRRTEVKFDAGRIEFGNGRVLRNVMADTALVGDWPERLRFAATEGETSRVTVELVPSASATAGGQE
ncbi:MAG: hypothetical protein V4773_03020, partial [Verrucomicrobiota bacterium]